MKDTLSISNLIDAVEAADSAPALVQAVRSLAAAQSPEAIPTLIKVLGFNNPGAAVAAVDGLVTLGREAVPALLAQLDGYNYGARAWAIRALAIIGDPRALDILVETARGDFALSVRRAAAKGLGLIDWRQLPVAERAIAQASALSALQVALADPEWVVRYATVMGLAGLAATLKAQGEDISEIQAQLQTCARDDSEVVVRARAQWALTQG
ncbi:MAG: HEAT repeat domain-containing protein [Leptolyngbya sp. SIO1E4]|nr:HEAT repeat domain-containing protein [Leptolyngbya sp. SIO1E4]